jgi:histone H3
MKGKGADTMARKTPVPRPRPAAGADQARRRLRRLGREPLLRGWSFRRLVRAAARPEDPTRRAARFESAATEALRAWAEAYLVHLFDDVHRCAAHGRRTTVLPRDIRLARRMRGEAVPSAAKD